MTSFPLILLLVSMASAGAASQGGQAAPPARAIPGITAKDAFPRGCVDCHLKMPEKDARISTLMTQWFEKVDPKLLARAQAFSPPGMTLKGKHPKVPLNNIPAGCLKCHARTSKLAPPLAPLLHGFHFGGGKANEFLTLFQGECTHCHKLNAATGAWSLPSGPEK
jgi:hypothetical protein